MGDSVLVRFLLQTDAPTSTPTPGVGIEEVVSNWPSPVRVGAFLAGFAVVFLLGWYLLEPTIRRLVDRRNRNNPTIREAISRYVRLTVIVLAVFIGASAAGYTRFLTNSALVVAAATVAVGIAGQEVIGSLVSGLALVVDPEFNVGDYIEWQGGEGTVRSITLRVTRVQTLDGEYVTVPNTVLTSQAITRPYGQRRYRIVDHVGIAYEDDVDEAITHLEAAAAELERVLPAPEPTVYVDEFGSDAVVLRVQFWVGDPRRSDIFQIRSEYAKSVKRRLDAAGITISPPSKRELLGRVETADGTWQRDGENHTLQEFTK
jgi:small-conductance mechanosensitive channel